MIATLLLSLALGVSTAHATTTDTIGNTDVYNNNGDMLKVVRVDVAHAAGVSGLRFGVYNNHASDVTPVLVLYKLDGDTYNLVEQIDGTDLPHDGQGWASASPHWLLDKGSTYAIGAWMPDGWYYYYEQDGTADPWFGRVTASYRYPSSTVPTSFSAAAEQYFYYMEIDSDDADVDNDGVASTDWGGTDCNDADPTVGAPTTEIPYDGIDQDCSGSDLTDVDGDGQDSSVVGGPDCDDSNPLIYAGAVETCGDGIDQDCDGSDLPCPDTGPVGDSGGDSGSGNGGNGGKGTATLNISPSGCGCATSPAGDGVLGAALLAGALLARRRR